jgi:hypothetical protein
MEALAQHLGKGSCWKAGNPLRAWPPPTPIGQAVTRIPLDSLNPLNLLNSLDPLAVGLASDGLEQLEQLEQLEKQCRGTVRAPQRGRLSA